MKTEDYVISEPSLIEQLRELMENEARSCSMDFGCVTPLYVYRLLGGSVSIDEITNALNYLKANNYE
jgi:hypothetical protein